MVIIFNAHAYECRRTRSASKTYAGIEKSDDRYNEQQLPGRKTIDVNQTTAS